MADIELSHTLGHEQTFTGSSQLAKSQAKVYSYKAFLNIISSRDSSYKSANKNLTISLSSSGSVRTHLLIK